MALQNRMNNNNALSSMAYRKAFWESLKTKNSRNYSSANNRNGGNIMNECSNPADKVATNIDASTKFNKTPGNGEYSNTGYKDCGGGKNDEITVPLLKYIFEQARAQESLNSYPDSRNKNGDNHSSISLLKRKEDENHRINNGSQVDDNECLNLLFQNINRTRNYQSPYPFFNEKSKSNTNDYQESNVCDRPSKFDISGNQRSCSDASSECAVSENGLSNLYDDPFQCATIGIQGSNSVDEPSVFIDSTSQRSDSSHEVSQFEVSGNQESNDKFFERAHESLNSFPDSRNKNGDDQSFISLLKRKDTEDENHSINSGTRLDDNECSNLLFQNIDRTRNYQSSHPLCNEKSEGNTTDYQVSNICDEPSGFDISGNKRSYSDASSECAVSENGLSNLFRCVSIGIPGSYSDASSECTVSENGFSNLYDDLFRCATIGIPVSYSYASSDCDDSENGLSNLYDDPFRCATIGIQGSNPVDEPSVFIDSTSQRSDASNKVSQIEVSGNQESNDKFFEPSPFSPNENTVDAECDEQPGFSIGKNRVANQHEWTKDSSPKGRFNIFVAGPEDCGKIQLIKAFVGIDITVSKTFNSSCVAVATDKRIGADFKIWYVRNLQKSLLFVAGMCSREKSAILLVYSVIKRGTLYDIDDHAKKLRDRLGMEVPVVLVGNKVDVRTPTTISEFDKADMPVTFFADGLEMKVRHDLQDFFECSGKTGDGVHKAFRRAAYLLIRGQGKE